MSITVVLHDYMCLMGSVLREGTVSVALLTPLLQTSVCIYISLYKSPRLSTVYGEPHTDRETSELLHLLTSLCGRPLNQTHWQPISSNVWLCVSVCVCVSVRVSVSTTKWITSVFDGRLLTNPFFSSFPLVSQDNVKSLQETTIIFDSSFPPIVFFCGFPFLIKNKLITGFFQIHGAWLSHAEVSRRSPPPPPER